MVNEVIIQDGQRWLSFADPVQTVEARDSKAVMAALQQVEMAVSRERLYAAGFVSYEAASAFGLACHAARAEDLPLMHFGLYREPRILPAVPASHQKSSTPAYKLSEWRPAVARSDYLERIALIKEFLAAGDSYQVNYTFPLQAIFQGDPRSLFTDLVGSQQAEYAAYLDLGRQVVCSVSPELFFELDGNRLRSKPMKGTAARGVSPDEDEDNIAALQTSAKNRAENVMIVDMIRNDMGRVAEIGSVQVPRLFEVDRYPTLLQMTSTVTARTRVLLSEIMQAMFPCASVTGAPKVRTMEIIRDLEPRPRGVYTGAIGFLAPGRQARFSVAIRTAVIDRQEQVASYGVGSGIVWDSVAAEEYAECMLKAEVLHRFRQQRASS